MNHTRRHTRTHRRATAAVATALMAGGLLLATGASATVAASASLPSAVSPADQQAMLAETNSVRQQNGQPPLGWDGGLANQAQGWADDPQSSAGNELNHSSINVAENISSVGPDGAVGQWASEKAAYDAAGPDHDTNSDGYRNWGHYYNMVQPHSTKMGCGARSGADVQGGWVTVCHYS
ncbi:CAP domain-containing protein [Streptomyces sp. H27-H5]|uniref:CAP domain-containing protein n=1 Tax=Streptomyces sp. H27-H5 TaxID=2996460 RepID=UPI00226DDFCE|nr:CAP domain-containing protein [Streptomyces sp. H27-H5]MCY0959052.1 CAP domain-containing protein [Streptomyces sp. H27-H5]